MFDRKKFRHSIDVRLQALPEDRCAAFALRSAMRVLPLLAARDGKPFRHWKPDDKSKYLLAVLRNYVRGVEFVLTKGHIDHEAANADAHIVHAAAAEASYADVDCSTVFAANAAYTAYTATTEYPRAAYEYAHAIVPDFYNYATAAAYTADSSIDVNVDKVVIAEILHDLIVAEEHIAETLLQQPLWASPQTKEWHQLNSRFKFASLKLETGFGVWLDWYDDRLAGKPVDIKLLRQWNSIPAEIEVQGVAAMNAYLNSLQPKPELTETTETEHSYLEFFQHLLKK
jgi:hypothetical protein